MTANSILLQKKYTRIIALFAKKMHFSFEDSLDFFYNSKTYDLISNGISDMHCMSDEYLTENLIEEYNSKNQKN